ncbi:MAG TPA: ABC transporter permease subunit [Rhizomicrobium sp.]|jgi:NitT/TauT family transport system permease protein|nr:ABC transporter permease subunit [Rhizomicrobium sp.]HEX4533360.1 ABC transporter permease subunit [Rhizomicrobium sp.]
MRFLPPVSIEARQLLPSRWDVLAAVLVLGFIVLFADASRLLGQPLVALSSAPISLDPAYLPEYALRTGLRMLIAMAFSLVFTFTYATLAAKSARAGALLIPLLDILQSVPILGFISITIVFFLSLTPGRVFGAELAAVFAIFTSQAWNMAFSFYQSLRTVPAELTEAGRMFGLNGWARFWRIEAPFAMPGLVWNMMMSMSGGWFFVVAAEAFSVGHTDIMLPGIGSYIATAIAQQNLHAIFWAIGAMLVVILIYDQLMFRPLVAWADRFRIDQEPGDEPGETWALTMFRRARLIDLMTKPFHWLMRWSYHLTPPTFGSANRSEHRLAGRAADVIWNVVLFAIGAYAFWRAYEFARANLALSDVIEACGLGALTFIRVAVLIAIASAIWTPIGVYIGLRPRLARVVQPVAQFLAAFPANILFPVAVSAIVMFNLDPNIWLSPLMVLGTQWYILFNVIAGASALPKELRDASTNLRVGGWLWWRKVALPSVFPYYVTGAITASGGSWNASIVAEYVTWGSRKLHAQGLGDYIARATHAGDFRHIVLGIAVMSLFVAVINRLFWRPLYWYAERKFRLD